MFFSNPFVTTVALGPLAIYLLVIGGLRLSGKPLVTTGARDFGALAVGLSGLVAIGPLQLFFPNSALAAWGPLAWGLVLGLYALSVVLIATSLRPRMVLYGIGPLQAHALMLSAARTLDPEAQGQDEFVSLPQFKVRFRVDGQVGLDTSQVVLVSRYVEPRVWWTLLERVKEQVAAADLPPRPDRLNLVTTATLLTAGGLMAALIVWRILNEPQAMQAGLRAWLRL